MSAPIVSRPKLVDDPKRTIEEIGQALQQAFDRLFAEHPAIDSALVEDVKLNFDASGNPADTVVRHGLGRAARGVQVVKQLAAFQVWMSQSTNAAPNSQVVLSHNAAQNAFARASFVVF